MSDKYIDELVDQFVDYVNQAGFEPKFADEIPQELRTPEVDHDSFNWTIRAAPSNPWIDNLVNRLPQALPAAHQSFVKRYRFCNFEVGPLMFFANTGQNIFYELSDRAFLDKFLFPTLHKNGYLEFGKPHQSNYDPVCFAMQRRKNDDAPIVQLDHEEILIRERIRIVREIAPSFKKFLQQAISEKLAVL